MRRPVHWTMKVNVGSSRVLKSWQRIVQPLQLAHRLSTIRNADEILVVADNGIAERGTHDELIARGGIYAHYYEMS